MDKLSGISMDKLSGISMDKLSEISIESQLSEGYSVQAGR